jgi:hypothetical protein
MKQDYPDISSILAAKTRRRRALAALSWEEKVAIIDQMRKSMPKGMWKDVPEGQGSSMPPQADHPHR